MDPNLYPSNSLSNPSVGPNGHTAQVPQAAAPREKKPTVVQGMIAQKKPTFGQKLKGVFIAQDISDVKHYILNDILLPSFRNMIVMGAVSTIYAIFLGKRTPGQPGMYGYGINPYSNLAARAMYPIPTAGYTSYGNMTTGVKANGQPTGTAPANPYGQLIQPSQVRIPTRGEAELVRDALNEIMINSHRLSIADFFDTVGTPGNGPIDNNYGWTDLTGMHIESYADGFGIMMPKAVPLQII